MRQPTVRAYKICKRFDCDISAAVRRLRVAARRRRQGRPRAPRLRRHGGDGQARARRRGRAARPALDRGHAARRAVTALAADFAPLTDLRACSGYRLRVAANLLRRLLARDAARRAAAGGGHQRLAAAPLPSGPAMNSSTDAVHPPARRHRRRGRRGTAARVGAPARRRRGHLRRRPARARRHAARGARPVAGGARPAASASTWSALRALPGVVAVFTAADIPGPNDCGPIVHDDPILAEGEVHYLGQPVFAVIAADARASRAGPPRRPSEFLQIEPLPAAAHAARGARRRASTCCRRCT